MEWGEDGGGEEGGDDGDGCFEEEIMRKSVNWRLNGGDGLKGRGDDLVKFWGELWELEEDKEEGEEE